MEQAFHKHRSLLLRLPPNSPIHVSFSDIRLDLQHGPLAKAKKTILKGVYGTFKAGELTAIMGPSGAGKSSLLNILTGLQVNGVTGSLRYGQDFKPKRFSCYIMQDDHLNPLFTVHETMTLAADLKLGSAVSYKAKQILIDEILEGLGMSKTKDTRCGQLSGGQKKRLSIALELIDNPPVMYLDEPTSGLDSSSSLQLITTLKNLTNDGRNIICTIHQPSATIFEMFDHIYLLAEGTCLYQGSSRNIIPFLQSVGLNCPKYHNPADYMLDVVAGEFGDFSEYLSQAAQDPSWRADPYCPTVQKVKEAGGEKGGAEKKEEKTFVLVRNPTEWTRMPVLIKRCVLQLHRDWTLTYLKLGLHVIVSIVLGLLFQNAGKDADKTISNLGYIMFSIVYISFTSLLPAILRLPSELKILQKEYFNNWYKFKTFYLAFLIVNVPLQMVFSSVYICVSYYISNQSQDWMRFLKFLFINLLVVTCSECLGLSFGAISNPVNGVFLGSVLIVVLLMFGGYLVMIPHMSDMVYYTSFGSFMRYAYEAMIVSTYGFGRAILHCPSSEIYCHLKFPTKILEELGMYESNFWIDVGALMGYIFLFGFLSYFLLNKRIKSKI